MDDLVCYTGCVWCWLEVVFDDVNYAFSGGVPCHIGFEIWWFHECVGCHVDGMYVQMELSGHLAGSDHHMFPDLVSGAR